MNTSSQVAASPYKGLMPYSEEDTAFFFGREDEREIITANLLAARLTLFYGASGVGKSSVLRAGVVHHLREQTQQNLRERGTPEAIVVVFNTWRDDPLAALASRVQETVSRTLGGRALEPVPPSPSLAQTLQGWTERVQGDLLIILDQFEEYLLYHAQEDGPGTFATEFPRAVNRPDLRVSFLLSIREDALAKLDRFKGRIPNLFDNYLRLEHLRLDAAREAIVKPIEQYNRLHPGDARVTIEPALVDAVLAQVRTGGLGLGDVGRGEVKGGAGKAQIETPFLQLVMTSLWDAEMRRGSRVLRLETLNELGGAVKIVRTHLDAVMSTLEPREQDIAAKAFRYLVTPSGTKIAFTVSDLAKTADLDEKELTPVMEKLGGDIRILRPVASPPDEPQVPRYEIFHDVLADPILDWRARFVQAQERAEAAKQLALVRRRVARLRLGLIGLSLLLLLTVSLAIFAIVQRNEAARAQAEAQSRALAESAILQMGEDPQRGLILAIQAAKSSTDRQVEQTLREALLESHLRTVLTHAGPVHSASYSPEGKQVLTASDDGAHLWDAETGRPLRLFGYAGQVNIAAFSPNGKQVVTASADGTVILWDATTGQLLGRSKAASRVSGAAFSPDGKQVVTVDDNGKAMIVDLTAQHAPIVLTDTVRIAAFSRDGEWIISAGCGIPRRLWSAADGTLSASTLSSAAASSPIAVLSAAFSPDGKEIVTPGDEDTASICDAATGSPLRVLTGHNGAVLSAAFSPDGKEIVTASADRTARIWDADSGRELTVLLGHLNQVLSAVFSPDGRQVITGSADGTAALWDVSGGEVTVLRGHTNQVKGAAFSADGQQLVTISEDDTARVWDVKTWATLHVLPENSLVNAAFSPDGQQLLTVSPDRAHVWNLITQQQVMTLTRTPAIGLVAYSQDGKEIVSAGCDVSRRIWDSATGAVLNESPDLVIPVLSPAFSRDGKRLVTNQGGAAQICNAATGAVERELGSAPGSVLSAAFSPLDNRVVTAHGQTTPLDQIARIWNLDNLSQPPVLFSGHTDWVENAAFSPDGRQIATASRDQTARIWDAATGREVSVLRGHTSWVLSATFSPDGRYIVTTGRDGTGRVYLARLDDLIAFAPQRVKRPPTCEERRDYLGEPIVCGPTPTLIALQNPTPRPSATPQTAPPSPSPEGSPGPLPPLTRRVFVVVIDPILDASGKRLTQYAAEHGFGWNNVDELVNGFAADIQETSGGLVRYTVVDRKSLDTFPALMSGRQYDAATYLAILERRTSVNEQDLLDYSALVDNLHLAQRVANNEFDEVWLFGPPLSGLVESRMVGRGAFFINGTPLEEPGRRFVIMGFNYERGVGEALEFFGHRAEFTMARVFDSVDFLTWAYNRGRSPALLDSTQLAHLNLFERFILFDQIAPGHANVGLLHYAPNSTSEYDWGNTTLVPSAADDWLRFPNLPNPPNYRPMNSSDWGGGDIRLHHKWWLMRLPKAAGTTDGVDNNWWKYVVDPNNVP